jgi:hypothetical protein
MSGVSVPAGSGLAAGSTLTFNQMISDLAILFGLDGDDEKEAWIGRQVKLIIDELNAVKLWRFNLVEAAEITAVAGQSTYSLPADLWRQYSARKTNDIDYSLSHLRQYGFDTMFQSQNNITGFPYIYVTFNIYRDGTFELFPQPEGGETILLRYYRLISEPGTSDFLDLPKPYQQVPFYGAAANVAQFVGQNPAHWTQKFELGKLQMIESDEDEGDENLRFLNIEEYGDRNASFVNPALRPRFLDFY